MGKERIGILGPGAVGGLLAARLAQRGHDVTVIGTEPTVAAIVAGGLRLHHPGQPAGQDVPAVWPDARCWLTDAVDILFIAVKAPDLLTALLRVPAERLAGVVLVPLLNGIDHVPLLRSRYPAARVLAATIGVEAARRGPGVIQQLSVVAEVEVAEDPAEPDAAGRVADLLSAGGFIVRTLNGENQVLWRKLAVLAPFALLTASTGAPLGEALTRRPEQLVPLCEEAAAAARACGADVLAAPAEGRVRSLPPHAQSSLLRDLLSGRALELDAIAGPVVRALSASRAPATVLAMAEILDHVRGGR